MITSASSVEGLWSVEFVSTNQRLYGAGTVTLESGEIFGGDNQYTFTGKYSMKFDILEVELDVKHFSSFPAHSIFGTPLNEFCLKLTGKVQTPTMQLVGSREGSPNDVIVVVCTKQADLP